jgi:eukaryotic-like serine/threonine-protein kinase
MPSPIHNQGDLIFDRYRVVELVGEGGMQQVFRAHDESLDRAVAIKVPKNPSARKRFHRSAEVSARVTHPNVAQTLDFLPEQTLEYLVEEFIDGADLQARLNEDFLRLDPHLAAHLIHHVAKGIAACHAAGVVHRDLKPSNIMVSHDPSFTKIKITDFGIAKMAEAEIDQAMEEGDESITASATVVGALPYMAPEVIQDRSNVGPPCDVWAAGAILFHILVGERPFGSGLNAIPKILKHDLPSKERMLDVKQQFRTLVDELWVIIEACLNPEPQARITALDLAKQLSEICYSTAPRMEGVIYNFRAGTGNWGFIRSDKSEDCFFHASSYYGRNPTDGERVNFAPFPGQPQPRAFPVLPLR